MFSSKRSPLKVAKHPAHSAASASNPFDSDDEHDEKHTVKPSRKSSSEPKTNEQTLRNSLFDGHEEERTASKYSLSLTSSARNKYKNDFRDSGGLENQSVQELEDYAVYKAEETTKTVNGCLRIAEDMRGSATNTLVMLHQQGEQITRTHRAAADIDHDLSRGEKLLGSLGGIFSKTWRPKKTRAITGPEYMRDDVQRQGNHMEQREKLGLTSAPRKHSNAGPPLSEPNVAMQKVEMEKAKQDDALSDLSNILDDLKDMAIDMGSELERQNKALEPFGHDVDELNYRVKQANQRGRRLLHK